MNEQELATLAGGCFWCTEAIFRRLKGVNSVISGYSGGLTRNPNYIEVSSGLTGHAEAIQINFDPSVISYKTILDIFWHLHDPTTKNRQGNDVGTQYRSVIFYHNDEQKRIAQSSKERLAKNGVYTAPILTEIVPYDRFYPAESYHREYFDRNRTAPYCSIIIEPKIRKLLDHYGKHVQEAYRHEGNPG